MEDGKSVCIIYNQEEVCEQQMAENAINEYVQMSMLLVVLWLWSAAMLFIIGIK